MSTPSATGALEAIDRILNRGGDADEVLRQVVSALHERAGYAWAGIYFVEGDGLQLGPSAGEPDETRRITAPVVWQGQRVAELAVDGSAPEDRPFLDRVGLLVSGHCLVGWDTGGEPWDG
jgi:GAF domain-containing protein